MLTRRRSSSLLSAVAAALLMSAGCSSSSKSLAGSGGTGGAAGAGGQGASAGAAGDGGTSGAGGTVDASTSDDHPDDGSVDAPGDVATSDAASFCHKSIAEYCPSAQSFFCTPTWTDVLAPRATCGTGISVAWAFTCGAYNVREFSTGGDVTWDQYYDMATGALVAVIVDHGAHCVAGPPDFVPQPCQPNSVTIEPRCPDGGVDAAQTCPAGSVLSCATMPTETIPCTPTVCHTCGHTGEPCCDVTPACAPGNYCGQLPPPAVNLGSGCVACADGGCPGAP